MHPHPYNSARTWQIACFALNNSATNLYLFFFMFIMYYATGVAGLLVVVVSSVVTFSRVWDGITDPIIGYFIDKTESRLGKFRPFMVVGNLVLALTTFVMISTTHLIAEGGRILYFIAIYCLYIIGYTFQTACTKAAQTVLTNDPKKRPLFTLFDATYNTIIFVGGQMVVASILIPKHGDFNLSFFHEAFAVVAISSALCTALAVLSIWNKDVKANWGVGSAIRTRLRDYIPIFLGNRPLQMLMVAASTDKLANQTTNNAITTVILFGIVIGDYAISGNVMLITTIPTLLITFLGIAYARRLGTKQAYVLATWLSIIISFVLLGFMLTADMKAVSLSALTFTTIAFLVIFSLQKGAIAVGSNIVIPMIADCADYELYISERYIPGMIGTIFSFIDKMVSSLSTALIGALLAVIGFRESLPSIDTELTPKLLYLGILFLIGIPCLAWIASLIAMKFYALDGKRMVEIQRSIHEKKMLLQSIKPD